MAGIGLVAAATVAPFASAQMYSGNTVYKVMRSNGTAQVIVANRTPGESLSISWGYIIEAGYG